MAEEYDPAFPTGDDDDEVVYSNISVNSPRIEMCDFNPPVEEQEVVVSTEVDESYEDESTAVYIPTHCASPPQIPEECDSLQEKLQKEYCLNNDGYEEVKTAEPIDIETTSLSNKSNDKNNSQSSGLKPGLTNTFSNILNNKLCEKNSVDSNCSNSENCANFSVSKLRNSKEKLNLIQGDHLNASQKKNHVLEHTKESPQNIQGSADNSDSNNSTINSKNDYSSDGHPVSGRLDDLKEKQDSETSNKESSDDNVSANAEEVSVNTTSPTKGKRKKSKTAQHDGDNSESNGNNTQVRRSSRIKSMEQKKEREREEKEREERERYERECEGKNRFEPEKEVKDEEKPAEKNGLSDEELSNSKTSLLDGQAPSSPLVSQTVEDTSPKGGKESPSVSGVTQQEEFSSPKPEKVKSRWRRSSELERAENGLSNARTLEGKLSPISYHTLHNHNSCDNTSIRLENVEEQNDSETSQDSKIKCESKVLNGEELPYFEEITENVYLSERRRHRSKREVKRMVCDCSITKEEIIRGAVACGEDCLNRLLMIECGSRCPTGEYCTNKRFQKKNYVKIEPVKTELKGWGLQTLEDIPEGTFIMEYVGEVLDPREFRRRVKEYARDKNRHYYFMALKSDEIIDATKMGNASRFINHSCNPNCETQKWTVNGELRIGFFSRTAISAREELTFDYQFQRYGKEAQKCYCLSENCRGYIGGDKRTPLKRERNTPKRRKTPEERKREFLEDMDLEEEIEKLSVNGGLKNRDQTLTLSRLMIRAEDTDSRLGLLKILQKTTEQACLRLFLDYHGLSLVWSWMVDIGNNEEYIELKNQILQTLQILPITNKTILMDSRVMAVVQRWAQQIADYQQMDKEKDRDSETADSEPTSQAATPRHSDSSESDKASETAKEAANQLKKVMSTDDSCSSCSEDNSEEIEKENGELKLHSSESDVVISENSTKPSVMTIETNSIENDTVHSKDQDNHKEFIMKIDDDQSNMNNSSTVTSKQPSSKDQLSDETVKHDGNDVSLLDKTKCSDTEETKRMDVVDETVEMISDFVKESNQLEDKKASKEEIQGMILENSTDLQEINCLELKEKEGKDDEDTISKELQPDEENVSCALKENQVANLASKLLESWSNLKEAYRIPKREQNQNRREHEREADRHVNELEPEDEFCENSLENDFADKNNEKVKDREMDYRDYYQDRDHEKRDHHDRKHNRTSPEKEHRHIREKKGLRIDDVHSPENKGKKRPRNNNLIPLSHNMMPLPPKLSKEERRHLFELKVQQEEAEEALRKQHEEFIRQQHEALMTIDPAAAAAAVYYDPNFPQPAYFDPNSGGYLAPPISIPAPVEGGPVIEPNAGFEPAQPSPVLYQQPVIYQGQPPPFLPPPATAGAPAPAAHFVAPAPTPPIYYPPQNIVPNPSPGAPAVIHLPDQAAPVQAWSQSHLLSLIEEAPPPPEPPKPKPVKLPPNWKTAKDSEGRVYYYHSVTRQTQWEPPSWDPSEENDMDLGTPTYDEPKSKKKLTTTAAADTSSELAKKTKELFRTKMSQFIVQCLNPYRKPDCKIGRISSTEDFKHLARKLTHFVMAKELKHCRNIEDLECNDNVKHKAKDFVKKYMLKFGSTYRKAASPKDD